METFEEVVFLISEEKVVERLQTLLLKEQVPVFVYEDKRSHRERQWIAMAVPPEFFPQARFFVLNSVEGAELRQEESYVVVAVGEEASELQEIEASSSSLEEEEGGDREEGSEAVAALRDRGEEGIPGLIDLVLSGDEDLAMEASEALKDSAERALPLVFRRFESACEERNLRDLGLLLVTSHLLGRLPSLFPGLFVHADPSLRAFAFRMSVDLSLPEGPEHLLKGLRDSETEVREEAADLLFHLRGSDLGFDPELPPEKNDRLLGRLEKWMEKNL